MPKISTLVDDFTNGISSQWTPGLVGGGNGYVNADGAGRVVFNSGTSGTSTRLLANPNNSWDHFPDGPGATHPLIFRLYLPIDMTSTNAPGRSIALNTGRASCNVVPTAAANNYTVNATISGYGLVAATGKTAESLAWWKFESTYISSTQASTNIYVASDNNGVPGTWQALRSGGVQDISLISNTVGFQMTFSRGTSTTNPQSVYLDNVNTATNVDTTPPATPTNAPAITLSAAPSRSVSISWDSISTATNYRVAYSYQGGSYTTLGTYTENSTTFTASSDGSYSFVYHAIDLAGNESAASPIANLSVDRTPPATPDAPSATHPDKNTRTVNVSWAAVSTASSYRVYRNGSLIGADLSTNLFTDTSIAADGNFTYTISAGDSENNWSTQGAGTSISVIKIPNTPSTPTATLASSPSRTVTVTWSSVAGTTSYNVLRDGVQVANVGSTTFTENLDDGTYIYRVQAVNTSGSSASSPASTPLVVYRSVPSVPAAPTVSATGRNVAVSWSSVANATSYVVRYNGSNATTVNGLTTTFTNMTDGSYTFTVAAVNANGSSAQSPSSTQVVIAQNAPNTPGAPTAVLAVAPSRTVTVTWDTVERATSYNLRRNTTLIATGLTSGFYQDQPADGTYTYSVQAVGTSASTYSSPSNQVVVQRDAPSNVGAPTAVNTANRQEGNVAITWNAYSGATGYSLYRNGVSIATGLTNTTYVDHPGDGSHYYQITATNLNGTSTLSAQSTTVIVDTVPPNAATGLTATLNQETGSVNLAWSAPVDATSFEVYRNGSLLATSNTPSYVDLLNSYGTFTYSVKSKDQSGLVSVPSNAVSIVYEDEMLLKTPIVSVSVDELSVTLNWSGVAQASTYSVLRDDVEVYSGPALTFTETLVEGNYVYNVAGVKNADNRSGYSDNLYVYVTENVALTAPALDADTKNNTVNLVWTAVSGAEYYQVTRNGVVFTVYATSLNQLVNDGTYEYTVRAARGNELSDSSNEVEVTVTLPPDVPVISASVNANVVTVSWDDATNAVGYEINRDGNLIGVTDETSWNDTPGFGVVSYSVRSISEQNKTSEFSNAVTITLSDTVAPTTPLRPFIVVDGHTIKISEVGVSDATTYRIYRNGSLVHSGATATYTETLTNGTYVYVVHSVDDAGNVSLASPEAKVTLAENMAPVVHHGNYNIGRAPLLNKSLARDPETGIRPIRAR